jgi:small subunit ribosomal protein S8
MQFDPLNDALTTIPNPERVGQREIAIQPASKLIARVLDVMRASGPR